MTTELNQPRTIHESDDAPFMISSVFVEGYVIPYYRQPHRFFHSFEWIQEQIDVCRRFNLPWDTSTQLALYFSYVAYHPLYSDHFARSADLIPYTIQLAHMSVPNGAETAAEALRSLDKGNPTTLGRLLIDLGRIRLATEKATFQRFETLLRYEHSHLPTKQWQQNRHRQLETLLQCEPLFEHPNLASALDGPARDNLRTELDRLATEISGSAHV